MIGGFLGAGKTTAVGRLARHYSELGLRVGLITNDQGSQLVDTAMLRSQGFSTEEIAGGCFCCRFNSLVDAARKLTVATRPDVFIAEPVGSCTDLVATVTYPLRRIYGDDFAIAPLSVLVDPVRALRVFGLTAGGRFSEKVRYIYRKQLEEADLIVINKCDLASADQLAALRRILTEQFPHAKPLAVSARHGQGLSAWFERIAQDNPPAREAMEVDYETYAAGEALLGWLNAMARISAASPVDGNALLRRLAGEVQRRLAAANAEVAHLKMTLDPHSPFGELAVVNLVRNDFVPELSQELPERVKSGQLVINVRAEVEPGVLRANVEGALAALRAGTDSLQVELEHLESFQPGKPEPTHRIQTRT